MKDFTNKTVLITGASGGIGAQTARELALRGARVLLIARNENGLRNVSDEIRKSGGLADTYPLDVSDYLAVEATAALIKKSYGIPDIIINNAGLGKWRFIEETEYEEAIEMIKVPYLGAFFITKAFMPEMLERNSGHIVNMTSLAAITPFAGATAYIVARKAMLGFHQALSADLYRTGIKTSLAYFAKVESSYWVHNPGSEERLPKIQRIIPVISAKQAARTIVNGIARGRRKITAPFIVRVLEFMTWLSPFIARYLLNQTGYRRGRGGTL